MFLRRGALVCVPWLLFTFLAGAQSLSPSLPPAVGVSAQRLGRLTAVVKDYTERGRVAGVVTFVARGGRLVQLDAIGSQDVERHVPMRRDTIFRIASMSKAVTTVGAMRLVEEGKLLLNDPVSTYISAFKETTVAVPLPGGAPGPPSIVRSKRQITIRDLLTHTSGISYGHGPAAAEYKAAGIQGWYLSNRDETIGRFVDRLAALPFDAQPGDQFVYGYSTDVLGAVIEKISGQPLDQYLRARVFEPLHMADTTFFLPPEKRGRLATVYSAGPDGRIVRAPDGGMGQGDYVDGPRRCFSGGAGLLSTAMDYGRFLQMLANGGELDGVRLLGPKTVQLMAANHIGPLYAEAVGARGVGFGLGFEVIEDPGAAGRYGSDGAYGWGSAYYPRYFVDPHEMLVAFFLTQLIPPGEMDLSDKFRALVYQAIVGPVPRAGNSR